MRLFVPIAVNCILVVAVYLADKYTSVKDMKYMVKQGIIGVLFGCVSVFASSYGVNWLDGVVNVRDAAPLSAGLIFGVPAGIIAGIIGGVYRWFSVYWGMGGTYTQLACTIATILAGFIAAGSRKWMFDDKKPNTVYGICIAVVCEVIHMLIIFLTNMDNSYKAFEFVKGATVQMVTGNALAVGLAIMVVSFLSQDRFIRQKGRRKIAQMLQRGLLFCVVIAYCVTTVFEFIMQNGIVRIEAQKEFASIIEDIEEDLKWKSDNFLMITADIIKWEYEGNKAVSLQDIAEAYGVAEINITNEDGIIVDSTETSYINQYDISSEERSKAVADKQQGDEFYVQEYGPSGPDEPEWRKYGAVNLTDGGFIQVGHNEEQYFESMDAFIIDTAKNRHAGVDGFVVICDDALNMVTDNEHSGKHISSIGINPPDEMRVGQDATKIYYANIVGGLDDKNASEEYLYTFKFIEGYCIITAIPEAEAVFMRDASIYTSVFTQIIIFATLFVFIYILIKRVIINDLKKINDSLGQITEGNLDVKVDVRSNEEFSSLSDDINSTVQTLKRYIAEEAARIDKELAYAKQIQLSALPTNFPNEEDYGLYAEMIAAKEVGGDFYDFYKLDDKTIAFLVADVSGKGIPAAMFMMTAKTTIKDLAESGMDVNEIFTIANEKFCENNESNMFVTCWMGILDVETGKLQYANAGHNPPLLKRADGSFEYLKTRTGFILAGMEGIRYRSAELTLSHGDRIFLYTDGVTEATNENNKLYGENRLHTFMNQNADRKAKELLKALKENIDEFVGEAPQFDDITMLMFDYRPQRKGEPMTNKVFPAKESALPDVIGFVEEKLENYGCSMRNRLSLCVAIEEVFVNVAHYAYGESEGEVLFGIGFDGDSRIVTFRMADKGVPFNPLERQDPDITLPAEERVMGGLGIFMTKKKMDTVDYVYENGENILTMTKKI